VILGHHGGEAPLLQAVLAAAGSVSVVLALFRFELSRLGKWFRRRPRNRSDPAPTVRRALLYMPIAWYPAST
jgi:hypothetical protein